MYHDRDEGGFTGVLSRKAYRIKQLNVLKNKVLAAQLVSGILN